MPEFTKYKFLLSLIFKILFFVKLMICNGTMSFNRDACYVEISHEFMQLSLFEPKHCMNEHIHIGLLVNFVSKYEVFIFFNSVDVLAAANQFFT